MTRSAQLAALGLVALGISSGCRAQDHEALGAERVQTASERQPPPRDPAEQDPAGAPSDAIDAGAPAQRLNGTSERTHDHEGAAPLQQGDGTPGSDMQGDDRNHDTLPDSTPPERAPR